MWSFRGRPGSFGPVSASYPDDADGDALRNVASSGADMSCSMVIDFSVGAPDEHSAREAAERVEARGYDPSLHQDDDGRWTVYCAKSMLATYEGVVEARKELNQLLEPLGCVCDGWASFGN